MTARSARPRILCDAADVRRRRTELAGRAEALVVAGAPAAELPRGPGRATSLRPVDPGRQRTAALELDAEVQPASEGRRELRQARRSPTARSRPRRRSSRPRPSPRADSARRRFRGRRGRRAAARRRRALPSRSTPPGLDVKSPRSRPRAASAARAAERPAGAATGAAPGAAAGRATGRAGARAGAAVCGRSASAPARTSASPAAATSACSSSKRPRGRGIRAAISVNGSPSLGASDGSGPIGRQDSLDRGTALLQTGTEPIPLSICARWRRPE